MTRHVITADIVGRIVAMAKDGVYVHDIWIAIGREVKKGYISVIISQARKAGIDIPYRRDVVPPPQDIFTVTVSRKTAASLDFAARRRKIMVRDVAIAILETVANDGLIDAVLDDGADSARPTLAPAAQGERG